MVVGFAPFFSASGEITFTQATETRLDSHYTDERTLAGYNKMTKFSTSCEKHTNSIHSQNHSRAMRSDPKRSLIGCSKVEKLIELANNFLTI